MSQCSAPAVLYVVGLGPGSVGYLTGDAAIALEEAQCLVGYDLYLDLVPAQFKRGKEIVTSGMRQEAARCRAAIDMARSGVPTALLSSGDPGIYAMASLTLEMLENSGLLEKVRLEMVPGVPSMCAAAALLGAPLGHDFACISLSDALTPWQTIEKRLHAALQADFVCVLYNPRSRTRPGLLGQTLNIASRYRKAECPVALAKNIGRAGQVAKVFALADFDATLADMCSLVIIGNSESRLAGSFFLTPRGYAGKRI